MQKLMGFHLQREILFKYQTKRFSDDLESSPELSEKSSQHHPVARPYNQRTTPSHNSHTSHTGMTGAQGTVPWPVLHSTSSWGRGLDRSLSLSLSKSRVQPTHQIRMRKLFSEDPHGPLENISHNSCTNRDQNVNSVRLEECFQNTVLTSKFLK